ncbi:hypothetical protein AB0N07_33030 [Streptomyces sp. NPDC051172]|uniref:hypothetical protein n=1 Tax=Streptomyces sp. NPDC051172 TaxID=3155796 RepID=UPI003437FFEA
MHHLVVTGAILTETTHAFERDEFTSADVTHSWTPALVFFHCVRHGCWIRWIVEQDEVTDPGAPRGRNAHVAEVSIASIGILTIA